MVLKEFIAGHIRFKQRMEEEEKSIVVWEIGTTEELEIEENDEVFGVLADGRIIDRIFEKQDFTHKLVFSTGEAIAPEQFKLIGKI